MKNFFYPSLFSGIFISSLTSFSYATVDTGISLMYQGKPEEALKELEKYIAPSHLAPSSSNKSSTLKKNKPVKSDSQALFYAALIYLFGDKPTIEKGLSLLKQAVHQGYAPALDTYAGLYLHGEFIPQDRHKALMYYEIAAKQGYGPSQFNCGILYKNGEKIPKDLKKAFIYLTLATHNTSDLDELTQDATHYRNEVIAAMTPDQYQEAVRAFGQFSMSVSPSK